MVRLVGHGTSDNAASYGVYAFGLLAGWTALRDSISLTVYYGASIDLSRSAVLALSQSGRTPDVVDYVERARAGGALTIALTNELGSELARTAELVLPLAAGTDTRRCSLEDLRQRTRRPRPPRGRCDEQRTQRRRRAPPGRRAPGRCTSRPRAVVGSCADGFGFVGRMFVFGRGLEYAAAREVALKLTEMCRVAAEPLTATDLSHGPVAALDALFPVWAIARRTRPCRRCSTHRPRARGRGSHRRERQRRRAE